MTEPSKAAKKLACELANEHIADGDGLYWPEQVAVRKPALYALALRLDFEDKVARENAELLRPAIWKHRDEMLESLRSLMLPDEPDPLREVLAAAIENSRSGEKLYEVLRAELKKRGGKIVWEEK